MNYTDFWKRTNELIKLQSKTQRGLALECGFTERRIETLSSNNRSPDVIEAVKIAEALNTSVEFLVSGKEPDSSQNINAFISDIQDVIQKYSKNT